MYGSDSIMLGIESAYQHYLRSFRQFLDEADVRPAGKRRILFGNAVRYLGLGEGGKARRRLEAWHRKHGLDQDWLMAL